MLKWTSILLAIVLQCSAQTPPVQGAELSGRVTDEAGAALAGAQVTIAGHWPTAEAEMAITGIPPTLLPTRTAVADEQGRFKFGDVVSGTYSIAAELKGYLRQFYGGHPGLTTRAPVPVRDGDKITGLELRVSKSSVIEGRVQDSRDEAVQGVAVYALRWTYTGGIRQLEEAGSARTDDQGRFRIFDLPPGRYLVYAVPRVDTSNILKIERSALPTYAPNSIEIAGAIAVEVFPGGQAVADVRLRQDQQFSIRGKVTGGEGDAPSGATVLVMEEAQTPRVGQGSGFRPPYVASARADAEGKFELRGLIAGTHRLFAFGGGRVDLNFGPKGAVSNPSAPETSHDGDSGFVDIRVSDQDVEGVVIPLLPAATVTRKADLDKGDFAEALRENFKRAGMPPEQIALVPEMVPVVLLVPESGVSNGGRFPDTGKNNPRATQQLSPGRYYLQLTGTQTTHYVKSVRLGGVDITGKMVEIVGGTAELNIVISADGLQLKGSVADDEGRPVSAATVSLWRVTPDLSRQNHGPAVVLAAHDGSFTHYLVAPGEYYVAAFEGLPDTGLGQYPSFLSQFVSRAERVKVEPNGSPTVSLKLIPKKDVERAVAALR